MHLFKSMKFSLCALALLLPLGACAAESEPARADLAQIKTAVIAKLKQARPDLSFEDVRETEVPELYAVTYNGGNLIYTTASGDFLIVGDIYEVGENGVSKLGEKELNAKRAKIIAELQPETMISFVSEQKDAKDIYVFTDVDCGYCRKLHREVPQLNELGVNVHYLAYPRAGIGSGSYDKMLAAWCAKDQQQAMTELKNQRPITMLKCDSSAVADQFRLGGELGVSGTPAIVLSDGTLIPGYQPAPQLAAIVKSH
ncbi:DsbC family protein [Agaribacterium haliotis]|uniref:DsbC family protein n=1 Tax=Agaribacterium haliotis TaxID=2013869 RepID=UPI000BB585D5|nr:DsbC family protein [Agaribacterium haliotis]